MRKEHQEVEKAMESAISEGGLYGDMMQSIKKSHSIGNTIRMVKLPIIFTDPRLYAGAIANFYWLTAALEARLKAAESGSMLARLREHLPVGAAAGYEADLEQLLGEGWKREAAAAESPATRAYVAELATAPPLSIAAAAFIIYGALVVGGGKATQKKVRRIFPSCEHRLFDVGPDGNIVKARKAFKQAFNDLGASVPSAERAELVRESARFMALNNTVVISIRCLPFFTARAAVTCAAVVAAIGAILLRRRMPLAA